MLFLVLRGFSAYSQQDLESSMISIHWEMQENITGVNHIIVTLSIAAFPDEKNIYSSSVIVSPVSTKYFFNLNSSIFSGISPQTKYLVSAEVLGKDSSDKTICIGTFSSGNQLTEQNVRTLKISSIALDDPAINNALK